MCIRDSPALRPDDGRGERLGDGQPRGTLLGPCELDRQPLPDVVRRDMAADVETFAAYARPVGDEELLQVGDGVAFDAKVLVAPLAHVISVEVVFRNIYATQVGDLSVDVYKRQECMSIRRVPNSRSCARWIGMSLMKARLLPAGVIMRVTCVSGA